MSEAFRTQRELEYEDLKEAAATIIEDGRRSHVTSAILLGELMEYMADWEEGWADLGQDAYYQMVEIARTYLRGS